MIREGELLGAITEGFNNLSRGMDTGFEVVSGGCGGVIDGKASHFDREASKSLVGGRPSIKSWEEGASESVLKALENLRGASGDTLDELPFHLEGLLEAAVGRLGVGWTGNGEVLDGGIPSGNFGLKPGVVC